MPTRGLTRPVTSPETLITRPTLARTAGAGVVKRVVQLCALACCVSLWPAPVASARQQQQQPGAAKPHAAPPAGAEATKDPEAETLAQQKEAEEAQAIQRATGFAERLLALKRTDVKASAVARLADLLWKHDEAAARRLFSTALELASAKPGDAAAEAQSKARVRRNVFGLLARRDPESAKRLIDEAAADGGEALAAERAESDFRVAYDLVKSEPGQSARFAERSLRGTVPPDMYSLLILLRLKDEAAANALFLRTLEQLSAQPSLDADALLSIGTYVFTSPAFNHNDPTVPPDITRVVGVGHHLVYDITADRPNVPREMVRAYLSFAARVLARTGAPPAERPKLYAAAHLLIPKAQRHAPELVQPLMLARQQLVSDVPPELTQEAAYANFKAPVSKEPDEAVREIEKERSAGRRDEQYLILISDLWRRADFERARARGRR